MNDFDFSVVFDENTVKIKKEYVDIKHILRKREENQIARKERETRDLQKLAEIEAKKNILTESENKIENTETTASNLTKNNDEKNEEIGQKREIKNEEESSEPKEKKAKKNKKERGQNKKRNQHFEERTKNSDKICRAFVAGKCTFGETCKFSHKPAEIWKTRESDLGPILNMQCPIFEKFGYCHYDISCRFADTHVTFNEDGTYVNKKAEETKQIFDVERNRINSSWQVMMRDNRFNFPKTRAAMEGVPSKHGPRDIKNFIREGRKGFYETVPDDFYFNKHKIPHKLGAVADGEKKTLDFRGKTYLAPLTTVGNLPFRRVCKNFGVDITCGEMALSRNLLQGKTAEWALTHRHESEDFFGVQIAGSWPDELTKVAELIDTFADVDFIDINCGCPIDLICNHGAGCKLGKSVDRLCYAVKGMTKVTETPITVKIRTGWAPGDDTAHKLIPKLKTAGASLLTLHGRSRICRYTGRARWDYIADCAAEAKKEELPFFGNGDILTWEDYFSNLEASNVEGAMIGRGALIKPWIFKEIKEKQVWDPSSSERLDMLRSYCQFGLEHWGSDQQGVANTRKFLLEWLSFLYRYVPVGILQDQVTQKINHRPPPIVGRDDLETMMASSDCADWIKITEMLLGPVPDSFNFLPKHKANSYRK